MIDFPSLGRNLFIAALAFCGACTPDAYRTQADRDVQKLIKDRQQRTTDYESKVSVDGPRKTDAQATQTTQSAGSLSKSYQSLPHTRLPDDAIVPVHQVSFVAPFDVLGPPRPDGNAPPSAESVIFDSVQAAFAPRLQYGPPAELGRTLRFDLFNSVSYAVENARPYQDEMERLYLAALDVTLQRHLFSPRPFASLGTRYTGGQQSVAYRSALTVTGRAGVRQRLPYGGEIVAEGLVSFVNALNDNVTDGESATVALRGSVPLLRGAGMVNLEPLVASERQLVYATRSFEQYRRNFAVDVASRYFRLNSTQTSLRNRFLNYRNLRDLTTRTEALFAAGRVNALEVQRAQQSLLSAEDQLNAAQQSLAGELDNFKVFLGMPVDQSLEVVPIEVEVTKLDETTAESETLALQYRLDLQTARDRVDDARRLVNRAQDGLGPDLTLDAGASIGNRDAGSASDIDARTTQYDAGLTLDLPIDRLPERNDYRASLIRLQNARRQTAQLEQQVLADVRAARRGVRSAELSLQIQRRGIDLARERLDFANESLLLGRVTNSREVVEAQQSLLTAQDAFDRARANLQILLLQFLRDTGTLRVDPNAGRLGLAMRRDG